MNQDETRRAQEDTIALARAGADRAAGAFEQLADHPIEVAGVDRRLPGEPSLALNGDWSTGVFFELEGCLDALVAVMFRSTSRDAIVETMLGEDPKSVADWCVESVLTEVANILVSHVASGIADQLEERLLPSVPSLALVDADEALREHVMSRGDSSRIECELVDRDGELGGLLVLVRGRPRG